MSRLPSDQYQILYGDDSELYSVPNMCIELVTGPLCILNSGLQFQATVSQLSTILYWRLMGLVHLRLMSRKYGNITELLRAQSTLRKEVSPGYLLVIMDANDQTKQRLVNYQLATMVIIGRQTNCVWILWIGVFIRKMPNDFSSLGPVFAIKMHCQHPRLT